MSGTVSPSERCTDLTDQNTIRGWTPFGLVRNSVDRDQSGGLLLVSRGGLLLVSAEVREGF